MFIIFAIMPCIFAAKLSSNRSVNIVSCDGVIFNDVYYDKEVMFVNRGKPYNLFLHKYSGVLFFSHTIQNGTHVDFSIASCHIETKKCIEVAGVPGGYAIAYDIGNDDIYFGGHDGIYKYNFMTRGGEFFAEQGKSIWSLFVKNHFYYIEYPTQKLYVYQDDLFVIVAEAQNIEVDNFFISKHNDIYFSNKTALYKVERSVKDVLHLDDSITVRQIAEDAYGDVYFVARDGIYVEERPFVRIKKVANIKNAFGLIFDGNDHAIYSDRTSVNRLLPSKYNDACYKSIVEPATKSYDNIQHISPIELFLR